MTSIRLLALIAVLALAAPGLAQDESSEEDELDWITGPATIPMGNGLAQIEVPDGFMGLGEEDTQQLMKWMENPVNGSELAFIAPVDEGLPWFIVFEWEAIGWVDDAERDELDPDALIESIREGTEAGNETRRENGWSPISIRGWFEEPHYDATTNNLTWAIEAHADGEPLINRMVKLLGRRGVMSATLVSSPEQLAADAVIADELLAGYSFQQGSRYAEFVPGTDDVAKYGLAALVAGGAGVALVQSGLLARFWKLIVAGLVAAGAGIKRLFKGKSHLQDPPTQV